MLGTILNLFGKSPFAPLQKHMEKASSCVHMLPDLFAAMEKGDYALVETIASKISELEHQADITKNDIRNHLPKSLFLPIDRGQLLDILKTQDRIADKAEDVAVLTTLKQMKLPPSFSNEFNIFLQKNISTFDSALKVVNEMHDLLESSFGGNEAAKVCGMVEEVAYKEHEADLVQRELLKKLFNSEKELTFTSFDLWQKICVAVAGISNESENLAQRIRMTLEPK